ncbi:hypothetical protein X956_06460 [Trueperella pyogenes TP8]|nr:hypothetical protein X956_06460 [Trueperella pyogenes TP8]
MFNQHRLPLLRLSQILATFDAPSLVYSLSSNLNGVDHHERI